MSESRVGQVLKTITRGKHGDEFLCCYSLTYCQFSVKVNARSNIRCNKFCLKSRCIGSKAHCLYQLDLALLCFAEQPEYISLLPLINRLPVHHVIVALCCV